MGDPIEDLLKFVHGSVLSKDVAVLTVLENVFTDDYGDGGNIEAVPGNPNTLFAGNNMESRIDAFFLSQGVNTPAVEVDTSWLAVGHVDEVVSFAPDGQHVAAVEKASRLWDREMYARRGFP